MNEQERIRRIQRLAGVPRPEIVLGIGDDCALYRPRRTAEDLVFTTDLLIEDVHFRRDTHSAADVGHKTLARGLSDIAAMGAEPRFCLLSLALPPWANEAWVDGFYRGLLRLARQSETTLAGGDLAHSPQLTADIVVCGAVPKGQALRRDAARVGDALYVSGRLGGSALGLSSGQGAAGGRHRRPTPQLALGQALRAEWGVRAAMDLSDGLSLDLQRLGVASGVAATVERVPVFRGATREQALHGGEDYELLFTCGPGVSLPPRVAGVPVSRIGTIIAGQPGAVFYQGQPLPALGYDHFAAPL